jgi:hypothetical protein
MKVRWKLPSATLWLLLLLHLTLQPLGWSRAREGVASFGRTSCCCDAAPSPRADQPASPRASESAGTGCCASDVGPPAAPGPSAVTDAAGERLPATPAPAREPARDPARDADGCGCLVAPDRGPVTPEPLGLSVAPPALAAPRVALAPSGPAPLVEARRLSRARRTGAAPPGAGPPLRILHERFLL